MSSALFERHRPRCWTEIVGQSKAIAVLDRLRERGGLAGRAYWLAGKSGTGKTSIARLVAAEVADGWSTAEIDGGQVSAELLTDLERECRQRPFGRGYCLIVNEAHGLRAVTIRRLLVILEALPAWVTAVFTTTADGQDKLFDDCDDAHPLLSRCTVIAMAYRDLAKAFAERARTIAQAEGLDGQPADKYVRLANECRSNFREMLSRIEAGAMLAGGEQ